MNETVKTSTLTALPSRFTVSGVVDFGTEDGIDWMTYNAPMWGAINGYVRIPQGHPWSGHDYDDIDVEVHGGLTFAADGWIGFDTLHAFDVWPGNPYNLGSGNDDIHWTAAKVADEAKALARKAAKAATS